MRVSSSSELNRTRRTDVPLVEMSAFIGAMLYNYILCQIQPFLVIILFRGKVFVWKLIWKCAALTARAAFLIIRLCGFCAGR